MKSQRAWTLWGFVLLILVLAGCADKPKEAAKEQEAVVRQPESLGSAPGSVAGEQEQVTDELDLAAEEQPIAMINQVRGQWSTEPYSRLELFEALIAHGRTRNTEEQAPKTSPKGRPVVSVNLLESEVTDTDLESLKGLTSFCCGKLRSWCFQLGLQKRDASLSCGCQQCP